MSIPIVLNGERTDVDDGLTLTDLLRRMTISPARVVVEHNRRVLRGEQMQGVRIEAGDEVEVVHFVGGG